MKRKVQKREQTFCSCGEIVLSVPVAWHRLSDPYPSLELCLQQVAFVEEEDYVRFFEQLAGADGAPEEVGVFEPVDPFVFWEFFIEWGDF